MNRFRAEAVRYSSFRIRLRCMNDEATYICDSCGEEVVIPVDPSAGRSQQFIEDCPVCCRFNVIHVEVDDEGEVTASAHAE